MIEGVKTVLLAFMSLFYAPLTVDDVMGVVNDTITNTCFEAYPVIIFNDTRMTAVACLWDSLLQSFWELCSFLVSIPKIF